jgi:hypothetical protein
MNLPPPPTPVLTPGEMETRAAEHFRGIGVPDDEARFRAHVAVEYLIGHGLVQPWGMSEAGEMVYRLVTEHPRPPVLFVVLGGGGL